MTRNHRIILIGLWTVVGIAAAGLAGTAYLIHAGERAASPTYLATDHSLSAGDTGQNLPALFPAPAFNLTDENGKPFNSDQLRGKVWVADFIFTNCTSLCPLMTRNMTQFQNQTADEPAIQMISFTVDPDRDTPAVLHTYAQANQANLARWHFLTGTKDQTWDISKAMKLAVQPDRGSQVMHSSHFLLVDQTGQVRGVYDFDSAGYLTKLVADAKRLAGSAP